MLECNIFFPFNKPWLSYISTFIYNLFLVTQ
nr:MAG TPA: hypothetical protein [Bacteriophage sp.]